MPTLHCLPTGNRDQTWCVQVVSQPLFAGEEDHVGRGEPFSPVFLAVARGNSWRPREAPGKP